MRKRTLGEYVFLERRELPKQGSPKRWEILAGKLGDCSHLLTGGVGGPPRTALEEAGLECLELEGLIDIALEALADNRSLNFMALRGKKACDGAGGGCTG